MTFIELMAKLADWIATAWNVAHLERQIILKPVDSVLSRFILTPVSVPDYLLLSFRAVYAAPPYQWIINLDRCKSYFGGVKLFEDFYHQVREFLEKCGDYNDNFIKIIMINVEKVDDLVYVEPYLTRPMLSMFSKVNIFNGSKKVAFLVDSEEVRRKVPAIRITHF